MSRRTPRRRAFRRCLTVAASIGLIAQTVGLVPVRADVLQGADGQTIPREPLLTPQQLGKSSVDGLQYGNPSEGLVLVAPPTPTSNGDAQLTYPMNVPQGRGITPSLQLTYDSGGGDGWAGVGWDLGVGSVAVDTRWGAPRFDPAKETESYTLDGDALEPNGLDGSLPRINADRQDFTRQVETQYEEITRLYATPDAAGPQQGPANYYWRVRDKMGDVFWYGGYPDAGGPNAFARTNKDLKGNVGLNGADGGKNGIDRSAIVTDANGNQTQWLLSAQRDVGVNLIKYHYTTLQYANTGSGWLPVANCVSDSSTLCAKHTYLTGIEYTAGAEASGEPEDAPYHVQFVLDSQLHPNAPVRTDATLNAMGGYLDLTSDRLAQVNVYYQPPVTGGRSYDAASPDTFVETDPLHPTAKLAVRYNLAYKTGAFGKTLLASVAQVGSDNATTATHTFDYFNDVNATIDPTTQRISSYQGLGPEKPWNPGNDNLNTTTINANTGVLGSAVSNSGEGHFYLGFNAEEPEKEGSFGGALKLGGGDSDNRSEWIDINSDGLPDKVWSGSQGIMYRKNLGGAGASDTPTFSDPISVIGLTQLSAEHNFNFNVAIEAFFGVTAAFGIGATYNWSDQYFIDVNGDGLPDFVSHGGVMFNHLNANGVPTFSPNSIDTVVPIEQGAGAAGDTSALDSIKADLAKQSPLVDTVRRWIAPYSGTVTIDAPATLAPPAGAISKDGVRVAIQQNGAEVTAATLRDAGDGAFSTPISRTVHAGDRLYFRVGSIDDGAGDQVTWSPTITYTAITGVADITKLPLDENGLDRTAYSASADFTLAGRPGSWANMPYDGTVRLVATVHKTAVTTDDLRLAFTHNGATVPGSGITIPAAFVGDFPISVPAFAVAGPVSTTDASNKTTTTFDRVAAYLAVDSPIDLTKVSWRPQLQYDSATTTDAGGHTVTVPTTDSAGNPSIVVDLLPEIEHYPFHASSTPQEQWTAGADGTYNAFVSFTRGASTVATPAAAAVLTIKDDAGKVVAKGSLAIPAAGATAIPISTSDLVTLNASIKKDTKYWFDLTVRDPLVAAATPLTGSVALRLTSATDNKNDVSVPALLSWAGFTGVTEADAQQRLANEYPLPYRGWGIAGYNGDGSKATAPIDETAFDINPATLPKPGTGAAPSGYEDPNFTQPAPDRAYPYVPVVKPVPLSGNPVPNNPDPLGTPVWQGTRANLVGSADTIRSSRLGSDSIDVGTAGGTGHAVDRTSISGPQFAATAGFGPASLAFSIGPTFGLQDYADMNGDGLPDIITPNKIQYTMPRGQYEASGRSVPMPHTSQDLAIEIDPGVSAGLLSGGPGKSGSHSSSGKGGKDASSKPGAGVGSFTLGAGFAWNDPTTSDTSEPDPTQTYSHQVSQAQNSKRGGGGSNLPLTSSTFADVNGDGLPDLVGAHPDGIYVRYNLGYGFAPAEVRLGGGGFSTSDTFSGSLGGGFMMPDESFSGGISANWAYTISRFTWRDVNGDGILDRIYTPVDRSQPTVAIGTGTGLLPNTSFGTFEATTALPGGTANTGPQANFSSSNGIGAGVDITIGIPCFLFCNIIIGFGGSYQNTNSSPQIDMQDVNGDGYPDSVKSTSDGSLLVRANQTGRTNLLSTVKNPLGGTVSIDYTRVGNTTAQPASVWTMSKVDINDGHQGDGVNDALTTFSYAGGRYDRLHRESLGFTSMAQNEVDPTCTGTAAACTLRTTTTTYLNDNVFDAGLIASSVLTSGGTTPKSLKSLANTWSLIDVRNGGTADLTPPSNDPANVRTLGMSVAPLLARTEALTYAADGTTVGAHSRMDFQYDVMGNVTRQVDYGQLDNPDDDVVATYAYSNCRNAASDDPTSSLNQVFGCGKSGVTPADVNGPVKNPPAHPSPLYSFDECATYVSLPITFDATNGKTGASQVVYRSREGSTAICDNSSVTVLNEKTGNGTIATTHLYYDQWGSYNRIVYPVGENGMSYAVEYTYDADVGHANIAKVHEFQFPADEAAAFIAANYVVADKADYPDPATTYAAHLGLTSTATFDPLSGRVATTTDPNNLVTRYTYDALGRLSSVSSPRDPSDPPLVTFSYDLSTPGNASAIAHTYDLFHPTDPIDTITFVDGNGRVTQNKRDARLFAGATQPATVGAVVSGHVDYDAFGRAVKEYNPRADAGPFTSFDATAPSGPVTVTSYDALDRTTRKVEPGERTTTDTYDYSQVNGAGPLLTRTTETHSTLVNGVNVPWHTYVTYSDIRNVEIASVDKPETITAPATTPDPPLTTLFTSDGMGQLLSVTDSAGSVTTNTYDWLGARTSTKTPDAGLVTYTYDAEGKLATMLTANEVAAKQPATSYHYDFGRLVRVDYPDPTQDVRYSYGGQGAPGNGAGRVVREEDASRIQTLTYDPAGDVIKQVAEMKLHNWPGPGSTAFQWTTQWSYDGLGRVASMVYPDGESLNYTYDAGGALVSISGDKTWYTTVVVTNPDGTTTTTLVPTTNHYPYLNDAQYDVFGHRSLETLGNAVATQDTYDVNTQWLSRQLTISPNRAQADAAHKTIQDLNYTYDAAGNPTTYANNLPAPVSNLFGGAAVQMYKYDGYNRIVSASGTWQAATGKTEHYTFALKYDAQGNVTSKSQYDAVTINGKDNPVAATTYSFMRSYPNPTTGGPHQAASDSTGTYRYDADGNLLGVFDAKGKAIRTLAWDANDRMTSINDSSGSTTYTYDDDGARRIERGPSGETAYVNAWVTVLNGTNIYKHIWGGDDRLATQKALSTGEETRYFLDKDLQGSTNMVTDQLGNTFQHQEYFPTGESWISENSTVFRTPYQYAGGYTDNSRDTINIGSRWYDMHRELFYSPDPALVDSTAVVDQPSIRAAYAFAGSNPVANADPTGRLFFTVNEDYGKLQAESREQIRALVATAADNPAARALFKEVYGRAYHGTSWRSKAIAISDLVNAPLFEFRFTKGAAGGSTGVTLSIFGTKARPLNATARLQKALADLAAAVPSSAHPDLSPGNLTPEAAKFAAALHQGAAAPQVAAGPAQVAAGPQQVHPAAVATAPDEARHAERTQLAAKIQELLADLLKD